MQKFKKLFNDDIKIVEGSRVQSEQPDENFVYHDKDTSRWGIESDILKLGKSFGKLFAVFVTAQNARDGYIGERWCFIDEDLRMLGYKPKSGYILCRYVTKTTVAGKMAVVCAINPKEGKIQFLKDAFGSDLSFDRPLKVQYMRIAEKNIKG